MRKSEKKKRNPMSKRSLGIRIGALVALLVIAGIMMVIGRGHTVYVDNSPIEGQSCDVPYKITVYDGAEKLAKLSEKDRGMAVCIGQHCKLTLDIEWNEGDKIDRQVLDVKLPYSMDGVLINLPGYLAELPQEDYLEELIIQEPEPEEDEAAEGEEGMPGEEGGDEFGIGGDV